MKKNYIAWDVNVRDFKKCDSILERIRFLVRFGVLAPSSHNSQPWSFSVDESSVSVRPDFRRALPVSDTNHRQLYISLGCAIENILVAANYYNFTTNLLHNDTGGDDGWDITIRCAESESGEHNADHLIFSIPRRFTDRSKYTDKLPSQELLSQFRELGKEREVQVDLVQDVETKIRVADVVVRAGIDAMNNDGFRRELSQYIKSNLTKSEVGMPGATLGIPTPISFIVPKVIKKVNVAQKNRKVDEALLNAHTPLFVVLSTKNDDAKAWIEVGRMYERIALEAEKRNVRTAPFAAPIQIGEFYKELQAILGISFRPQMFFRIGYSNSPIKRSPRISGDAVTTSDK